MVQRVTNNCSSSHSKVLYFLFFFLSMLKCFKLIVTGFYLFYIQLQASFLESTISVPLGIVVTTILLFLVIDAFAVYKHVLHRFTGSFARIFTWSFFAITPTIYGFYALGISMPHCSEFSRIHCILMMVSVCISPFSY